MIAVPSMSPTASPRKLSGNDVGWQSQSWRLTAFLSSASPPTGVNWWTDVVGKEPDYRVDNLRQATRQETGAYKDGTLILIVQPGRIDWFYTAQPAPSEQEQPPDWRSFGSIGSSLESFRDVAVTWLKDAPALDRLAVGAVLEQPVQSRQEAYRIISGLVPGLRLDERASDFLYQINRPRTYGDSEDRTINRLSKWSAATLQIVQFELARESGGTIRPISEFLTARLELDVNTAPGGREIAEPGERLQLYDELVRLGLEIAEKGDVD
jgi:hypothetical protein